MISFRLILKVNSATSVGIPLVNTLVKTFSRAFRFKNFFNGSGLFGKSEYANRLNPLSNMMTGLPTSSDDNLTISLNSPPDNVH